ncbi:xanthine dehydrogenase accessory protein XdhC [Roseovarius sp. ZX-A-9]|uniref:xanthine dehydrogenase accessory protein XdhC n=1 Tax=Roseovarius sp. ZX-A-9 TaxID=3014783 RepID=UPI002331063C|nr:xanthine dehydrogenase accessory protein XdhC [Roseovarius sp. ZX-A-9]
MTGVDHSLKEFLAAHESVVQVVLTDVQGSSPRNTGTQMFVAPGALHRTIGGGQLEFMVITHARAMLDQDTRSDTLDIPLGPEIGQCCGGRVQITLTRMTAQTKQTALTQEAQAKAARPHVYVMGAGHVGRALTAQLQHLPVHCILIDTRADELAQCTAQVETRLSAIPEHEIRTAPAGSAFVVLTHDHALDFLLTSEALARGDAAYVGMIGSATKRAKFARWCRTECDGLTTQDLICPIGASGSRDKRPSVIAAFVAAEIIADLTSEPAANALQKGFGLQMRKQTTGPKPDGTSTPLPRARPTGGGTNNDRPELYL